MYQLFGTAKVAGMEKVLRFCKRRSPFWATLLFLTEHARLEIE